MQQEIPVSLLGGNTVDNTSDYRDALPINMLAISKAILNAKGYLIMHSGLRSFAKGVGIDRGGIWNERLLAHLRVSGTDLIVLDAGGSVVSLGAISGLDTVSLPYSFNTQGIVADKKFYLYDPVNGLRQVVDDVSQNSIIGEPIDGTWIDGYYFLTDGENLYHTQLTDESVINALSFGTAEFSPDPTLGVGTTVDNKVIVFGRYSTEYFSNIATENFAFTRLPARAIKTCIVGTHCKVQMLNQWFILGGRKEEDVSVYNITVGNAQKVSSREVDKVINKYTEAQMSTSVLETRVEDDQHFIIVHLPSETLIYNHDIAQTVGLEQAWTILKSDVQGNNQWRGKHGIFEPRLTKFVYGDKQNENIGILDDSITTHYGELTEYAMFSPFFQLEQMSIDEIEIDTIAGYTLDDDATVGISITYDGGHYSKEQWVAYGLQSQYGHRFIARRLGYVRKWFGLKFRIASRSRMAFALLKLTYS